MQFISIVIHGLLFWHAIVSSSIINTEQQTSWNSIPNIRKLISEQNNLLQMTYGASNYLAKFQGCFRRNGLSTLANYLFSVEGENLILSCDKICSPPSKKIYWRWITFEGVDSALNQPDNTDANADDDIFKPFNYYQNENQQLVLTSPKPDLSSYYCYWEDTNQVDGTSIRVISKIWTVEIVGIAHMQKSSVRSWKNSRNFSGSKQPAHDVVVAGGRKIVVGTQWSEWSACSKCGQVAGKRYKTGFCSLDEISQEESAAAAATVSKLQVLQLHKLPISCSLLIDFHPDILSESTALQDFSRVSSLNHVLGRAHTILIGYCRTRRDNCVDYPGEHFARNKVISQLFRDFEMKGEGQSMVNGDDGGESWSARRFLWLLKSLVNGIPFGWNNLPEMVALVGLVVFQIYVIYLVLKWRNEAH